MEVTERDKRRGVLARIYRERVAAGDLSESSAQIDLIARLDQVLADLKAHDAAQSGWLPRLFGRRTPETVRGLYIWGGVGRGKTMLMDLFLQHVPTKQKRRVHFHEFMGDVHTRIGTARKTDPGDPIPIVANQIAAEARVLCFDELHVTDIADAMILGRLFRALFEMSMTVVATSNVPPEGLYKDGLNRDLFLPFVSLLNEHLHIHDFGAGKDYRLDKVVGRTLYFSPADAAADRGMDELWAEFTEQEQSAPGIVKSLGRDIAVPQAAGGYARFTFEDLCDVALGARDYLMIARRFHTIFIDRIPQLGPAKRNAARRFINLIDTLYDNRVCLVVSAAVAPDEIYAAGDGTDHFERTISRLREMRSEPYLMDRDARIEAKQAVVSEVRDDAVEVSGAVRLT